MTDLSSAVAELQSRWPNLCDLDRAQAVLSLQQEGMTLRELAQHLKCSPSLPSYLLRASQAPVEDRARARRGEISTRALARIAGTVGTRGTVRQHEAIAFERECAAFQASKAVLRRFEDEEVSAADQSQIIEEARLHLVEVQGCKSAFLEDRLLNVVHESRSAPIEASRSCPLAWFALRFALWALRRLSDDWLRDRALELACGEAVRSPTPAV